MDAEAALMTHTMEAIERASLAHYGDAGAIPANEADRRRVEEAAASWERYERHIEYALRRRRTSDRAPFAPAVSLIPNRRGPSAET